ncbi:MAG: hypothetical protein HYV29_04070 [Ignavibacteriales bacterium]|nr:hypothetical protein [Ignavibacteriales bacterium]
MNIITQPLDNLTFYGVSYDAIFTTVVTISIFIFGYIINRFIEYRKEVRSKKELRELIIVQLNTLLEPIEKQSIAFKELSDSIISKKYQDYVYQEGNYHTGYLTNLPSVDIYKSFVYGSKKYKSERIKAYNLFLKTLAFFGRQSQITKDQFIEFIGRHKSYIDIWNEHTNAIVRYHDYLLSFAKRNKISPGKDPFLKEFNLIIHNWAKIQNRTDIQTLLEHFLKPLKALCLANPSDERTNVLLPRIIEANQAYSNREHLLDLMGNYFREESDKLKLKRDDLKNILEILNK